MQLIPRSGLSAGRNALVQACTTRYIVLLDDDVFFTASTALDVLLDELERNQTLHIAAGAYMQYSSTDAAPYIHDYSLLFDKSKAEDGSWYAYTPQSPPPGQCYAVHGAHNFFMARTATLRRYPWHPKMGESEAASINMYTAPHTCSQHALPHLTCDQQPFLSTSTSSFNSFWPERGCFLALTYLSSTTGRPICTMNATCPTRCGSRRLSLRATSAIHFLRYARACDIRCVSSLHCPGTV